MEIFGFTDGVPYYAEKVKPPFWELLEKELQRLDTFLKDEIDFLMKYEFSDATNYKKSLEALASGKNTPKKIKEFTGAKALRHNSVSKQPDGSLLRR